MTLADFLLARIRDDDERAQYFHRDSCERFSPEAAGVQCDCGHPPRLMAECEAKRRIIDEHLDVLVRVSSGDGRSLGRQSRALEFAIRHLALPYADHPDYRDAWRP